MNPIRNQNYFALDLELNQNPETKVPKIIEVGVAIGNPTNDAYILRNWYVNPNESITSFITQLTGITQEVVETQSTPLNQIAEELGQLLTENQVFCNPITWGQGDAEELKAEFRENGIQFPFFGRRIIDVKTIFVFLEQVKGRSPAGGLSSAMGKYKLPFTGKPHRANVDAYNTLRFYFYLMNRQRSLEETLFNFKSISH